MVIQLARWNCIVALTLACMVPLQFLVAGVIWIPAMFIAMATSQALYGVVLLAAEIGLALLIGRSVARYLARYGAVAPQGLRGIRRALSFGGHSIIIAGYAVLMQWFSAMLTHTAKSVTPAGIAFALLLAGCLVVLALSRRDHSAADAGSAAASVEKPAAR